MRLDAVRPAGYATADEHLADEFRWLDARLSDHLRRLREDGRFDESALRGLRLNEAQVSAGLTPRRSRAPDRDSLRPIIDERAAAGPAPPLYRLATAFGLSEFERDALMIAAAPALDARYRAALALAQNDATRAHATPDLLIELLDPAARIARLSSFAGDAPLIRHRLLRADPAAVTSPLSDRSLGVDDRVVMALLGRSGGLADRHASALQDLDTAAEDWAPDLLAVPEPTAPVLILDGAGDRGHEAVAARRAAGLGLGLMKFDASLTGEADAHETLAIAVREARIRGAFLLVEARGVDPRAPVVSALAALAGRGEPHAVAALPDAAHAIAARAADRVQRVELRRPEATDRLSWWTRAATKLPPDRLADLAWRSRMGPAAIGRVRAGGTPDEPAHAPLPAVLRRVDCRWSREELVLSDTLARQLDELTAFVRNWPRVLGDWGFAAKNPQSRHCLALFSGPSGTGKTMAAGIVAAAAGVPLYRASLASIFDKYLGETEKQIDRLFDAAAEVGIALLVDEADALFGARVQSGSAGDAHARYANLTVAHLLQKVEEHEGLVILTSNLARNMDDAFSRRIGHALAFTLPDRGQRLRLWQGAIPDAAATDPGLDMPGLADIFELSGGDIRNAALAAAYLAAAEDGPIRMHHLLRAVERELEKAGRRPIAADFGRLGEAR